MAAPKQRQKKKEADNKFNFKVNDDLRHLNKVRLLRDGMEPEVMHISKARELAEEEELDIVLVTDKSDIPVVKMCNYEKMLYELKKNAKKNKASAKPLKEVELTVNIAEHDLETKVNSARKFLEGGHKVKVTLKMKGRELSRREENKKSILKFIVMLEGIGIPEAPLKDEGNRTVVILKKKG